MARARRRTTLLTVDTGAQHDEPTRFYRLVVGGPDTEAIREDLLVPDGDELRIRHTHDPLDDAA
jgi:hypothetical protein